MTSQIDMLGAPDVGGERDAADRYFTPPWCTRALLDYLGCRLHQRIWEPCAGHGHIVDVLRESDREVYASDITPHECLDDVGDFRDKWLSHVDWIVTNPPYATADCTATDIVRHALAKTVNGVAMLLRLSWMEPCDDRADILLGDPPTDIVVLPRVNYIGAPSSNNQTSAWFIWDRSLRTDAAATLMNWYPSEIRKPTYDWSKL